MLLIYDSFLLILYGDIGFIEPLIDFGGMLFYMNSYYLCFQVLFSLKHVFLSVWVVFQVWFRTWAFESVLIFSKYEVVNLAEIKQHANSC